MNSRIDGEQPALAVEDLRREYGPITALSGVSLAIRPGDLHCLVGPNGSGKTTLFRTLLGLTTPTDGRVRRPEATVGVGFQRPVYYPDLTVAENLKVFGRLMDASNGEWRERLVTVLGLERVDHRRAGALSGGYRKKLDLALALLKRPRFLLLDEPLSDLDDVTENRLLEFLSQYAEAGNAVLVSTHRIEGFGSDLDRLTVMDGGQIVFDRTRADLDGQAESISAIYADLVGSE
ncbi:ATP-binding cassette domain-containing protein [Halorhabdus rudnickae]|uniref:ATP-binding cassette domain-containing protein n=1 Tax=Halorhabdus rudnickae TaxID=1775544 RepID=UPI0010826B16|nr:ABC transporter ATP-binding protein [Halorhabdus rudnickae]